MPASFLSRRTGSAWAVMLVLPDVIAASISRRRLLSGCADGRAQRVLVDAAVLHDDDEVLLGIRDQADVLDRIAVDQQQVGERPLRDDADPAWIRVAQTGQSQQLAV